VLANRARRVANGITEDWIRQHTVDKGESEKKHWFSEGESENSSLSDSYSGEDGWLHELETPKASRQRLKRRQASRSGIAKQASVETLKPSRVDRKKGKAVSKMASSDERATPESALQEPAPAIERPSTPKMDRNAGMNGTVGTPKGANNPPLTPSRAAAKRTPRLKKKVPWKGKSVMILLPRDEERGKPGKAPIPLKESEISGMLRSWEQLGYSIQGFDLNRPTSVSEEGEYSQSRGAWPDFDELVRERDEKNWRVTLPDLNGKQWRAHINLLYC